jgi:hypothetical protein
MGIINTASLAAAIERETEGMEDPPEGKRDYEKEAHWFVAYQIADAMREDYTTKDWAHFVQEGMQPQTDKDVEEWLVPEDEPWAQETEEHIISEIRRFYGIK